MANLFTSFPLVDFSTGVNSELELVEIEFPTSRILASQGHVDASNLIKVNGEYILFQNCWSCKSIQ
jgi:hypothetical protein